MGAALTFRRLARVNILLLALCCAGCFGPQRDWTDDLAWSPDGQRAAVLVAGDLYVSDTRGNLSPLLVSDVYRVAWLGDSERLVFARTRQVCTFADISAALTPARLRTVVASAEHLLMHSQSPDLSRNVEPSPELWREMTSPDAAGAAIYLRERYPDVLREKLGEDWGEFENQAADLHALGVARVTGGRLEMMATLTEDLRPIKTIRPDPRSRLVAFVTRDEEFLHDDTTQTFIVPIDGSAGPTLVSERTGQFPDWTRDGRSLLYLDARVERDVELGQLGCLASRRVLDADDRVRIDPMRRCVVDLIFESRDRIRSLADGRAIFDTDEHQFPRMTSELLVTVAKDIESSTSQLDPPRYRQLFVFDPAGVRGPPTALIPFSQLEDDVIGYFDVSPDGTRVIYSTARGRVNLLDIAERKTELLPLGLDKESGYTVGELPRIVWAGNGAFTYSRKVGERTEIILRRGSTEVVLNRNWPQPGASR